MLRSSLIAAAAALTVATPAFAGMFTAETVEPIDEKRRIVSERSVWDCNETTCVAKLQRTKATVSSCKKFVKKAGAVKSYKSDKSALTEDQIAECNTKAKK